MMFFKFRKIISINDWKLAGHPRSPIREVIHSNCLSPGIVKAVACLHCSSNGICQNPDVRSSVEKMVDLAWPMSPMHSLISFDEYLSIYDCLFSSGKSLTHLSLVRRKLDCCVAIVIFELLPKKNLGITQFSGSLIC